MKSESTIRAQIKRLDAIVLSRDASRTVIMEAYEVREALRWVITDRCSLAPASILSDTEEELIGEKES